MNRILCYGWWPEQVLSKLGYIYHDFIAMELQWNRNQTKKKVKYKQYLSNSFVA